jgi:hypothetical protein
MILVKINKLKSMKTGSILFIIISFTWCLPASTQDCIVITDRPVQACLRNVRLQESSLKSLKNADVESLQALFYQYFAGTDYAGHRALFQLNDWHDLSVQKFAQWRSFVQGADVRMLGTAEILVGQTELGIVKYTYVSDDQKLYETFLAKKSDSQWRPASVKEEQEYFFYTTFVRRTNLVYLKNLSSEIIRNPALTVAGVSSRNRILAAKMLMSIDSIQAFDSVIFQERFNADYEYRTPAKYEEDRLHDTGFVSYLSEMQLGQDEIDVVMKYIYAQNYLHAAQKADDYSMQSVTYSPFIDKIREVYGSDRIRKWDPVNKKWY